MGLFFKKKTLHPSAQQREDVIEQREKWCQNQQSLFAIYVKQFLAPTLRKDDIVVMDNLSSHKVSGVLQPIYDADAKVLFLPPYSPDFNPIEMAWSKMKSIVRKLKPRTYDKLIEALRIALDSFTHDDILHWFQHDIKPRLSLLRLVLL